jgi:hypothetical protein
MANILGLALKINADASGVPAALTPVEKALQQLDKEAAKVTSVFEGFAKASGAAADVQRRFQDEIASLTAALQKGEINGQQFADGFAAIKASAADLADTFAEGARVTEQYRTEEDRRAETLQRLDSLLKAGAISEETYARASAEASGANAEAAKAEQARASALASAARIIQANLTPQERYDQQIQELRGHLEAGRLSQEQFNRAAARAKSDLDNVGKSAEKTDKNIDSLNRKVTVLAAIEIGRVLVDGFQLLSNAFTSATTQITSLVTSVNSSLDSLVDLSARTGLGAEALQSYGLAAKLAGVDTEQFGTAVQRLGVNIGKANPGDAFDKSLRGIGLSVAELRALAPEQQFAAIGEAISQLPTAADRAAASVEVFGKQGAALAPLFRDGAASLEELRARAERLGVIVDQTQIDNVASMNDAFDLVSATVKGIVGQVIGNLAPAVTTVTEEFLKFVEVFQGTAGGGGTGIANAITDVLLQGAEYFAGIFDEFVGSFTGFAVQLETAGSYFDEVAGVLEVLSGTFKAIFNTFEIIGNAVVVAFGKLLEQIGSFVSSDLERAGRDISTTYSQALEQNVQELEDAGRQILDGTKQAVFGNEGQQQAAATGAASNFLQALRERVERERSPQFKIETNIETTRDRFDSFFNGIVEEGSRVTDSMRQFEAVVASVVDPLNMTEEEIKRIEEAQRAVNATIDQELQLRQEAADAAAKQADEDAKRIEGLLKTNDAQQKIAEDLIAVEREQVRVQGEIDAARDAGDSARTEAALRRRAQLDQLQARLSDEQQAAEQGFGDGFAKAFDATNKSIDDLIVKAEQFGNVGALAAQALEQGIAQAQERARDGILTQETYEREVAQQRDIFQQRLNAAQRVEEFLRNGVDARQAAELKATEELEKRKKEAATNVQAIEAKLIEERKKLAEDIKDKDFAAARAGNARVKELERVQRQEQQLADGRIQQQRDVGQQFLGGINRAQQFQGLVAQSNETFLRSFNNTYAGANQALAASSAAAAEQAAKLEQLLTPTNQLAQTADIRTAEGQQLLLGLTQQGQDPALIEARLQTKSLNTIAQGITQAASNYFNAPVAIVGGAQFG